MKYHLLIFFGLILISCSTKPPLNNQFETSSGKTVELSQYLLNNEGLVILYLSPECPLCQNYSVAIRDLEDQFRDKKIEFIGVVSGDFYPKEQIADYAKTYRMNMDILLDPKFVISDFYAAQLTPEAHLIDPNGKLLYRGAIDNWAISLGKKRLHATSNYLHDALSNYLTGERIDPKVTEPVGCYIE